MAKISTYPIISIPTIDDLLIGTDVNDLNNTKNFTIGDIGNLIGQDYVPYVGATGNVNLGSFNITGGGFIVGGGTASQFLKADGSLDSTLYTPQTRTLTINGTTYNLSANRSWDLNTIDSLTTTGTSGDATYIGKVLNIPVYQAQGSYITQLSGEATGSGPGNATVTLDNTAVISKVLTGLNVTGGTVVSTDTILQAFGKVQNQINGLTTGVTYQGVWNAATNTPFLQSSVGTQGYYYVVDVAGTTNLNGITDWQVGDWAIYNGTAWQKVDNTDAVVSVNGYVGAVVLTASDVGAVPTTRTLTINGVGYNLSDDRAWTVGDVRTDGSYADPSWITSLGWSKITGTPTTLAGYGITDGALNTTTLTINGTTFDLTANRTWNVGTVTSVGTSGPLTGGTITGSGTIGITQSSSTTDGYLSASDWNTFNSKQGAISVNAPLTFVSGVIGITQSGASTDGYLSSTDWNTFNSKVSGSGTANTLPMWGSSSSLINSPLSYAADAFNFQYNSSTGGTVNFTNIGLTTYTYSIQMNNFGSPRSTIHSYTDGLIIQSIGGIQVSRIFANGNLILGTGTVDNGYKLEVTGDLYVSTIANAIVDTDRFIVSDGGLIKYRTGAQVLSDIGAQGSLTLTTTGSSGPATLIGDTLNIPNYSSSLTGYVPYTGATQNVNLGEYGLSGGYFLLDTTPTGTPTSQGTIYWDDSKSTAALIMNGTIQHIGQDTYFYVKNSTGSSIPKGTAVRFAGTDGASGHLLIAPFLADGTYPSSYFMGVTSETIANGAFGQVSNFGELSGIDTSAYTAGDLLYASTTVAGGFQTTPPVAPNNIVLVAAAVNSKNNGDIVVRPLIGSNINNDEGVKIVSPVTGQLLQLQSNGLWENKTLAQVLGGTSSQFVKGDGSLDSNTYLTTSAAASTYVPYTGATGAVDLGTNAFAASQISINGAAPTSGSFLGFKHATTVNTGTNGYTSMYTFGTNIIGFKSINGANNIDFSFNMSAITPNFPGGRVYTLPDASGTLALTSDIPANPVGGTGTTNYLPKFTGTSTIGDSALQETSGNLGLGVTPSAWFSTVKAIDISTATALWAGGNGQPALGYNVFVNTSGNLIYKTSEFASRYEQISGQHQWFTAPSGTAGNAISFTQAMTLFATGNLLVGSPSPISDNGARLQVSGAATFSSSVTASIFDSTSNAFRFSGSNALSLVSLSGQSVVKINAAGYWGSQIVGANDQGILINNAGNVGIGTSSPSSKLEIVGDAEMLNLRNSTTSTITGRIGVRTDGAMQIYSFQSGVSYKPVIFGVDGSFLSAGNVLIGTTTDAGQRLQVNGAVRIFAGNVLTMLQPDNGDGFNIRSVNNGDFRLSSGGTPDAFNVTNNGNVGIRTSSPTQKLTIAGTTDAYMNFAPSSFRNFIVGSDVLGYIIYDNNAASYRLTISPSGNLLVGTTSDNGARLQVSGSVSLGSGATSLLNFTGSSFGQIISPSTLYYDVDTQIFRNTAGTERMRITSSGNLGLGVTPSAWFSGYVAFEMGSGSLVYPANSENTQLWNNLYINTSGNVTYKSTGIGGLFSLGGGGNTAVWYSAPSGTSGTTATLTQAMTLTSSGNLLVGTTTDNGARLQVSGASTFGGSLTVNSTASSINLIQSSAGSATYYVMQNTVETGGKRYRFGYTGASADKGSFSIYNETDNILPLLIASTGAATFSSSAGVPVSVTSSAATSTFVLDNTNANLWGGVYAVRVNGSDKNYFGTLGSLVGSTNYDATIWSTSGNGFRVYTNGVNSARLTIDTTGAATFSSSVTAGTLSSRYHTMPSGAGFNAFEMGNDPTAGGWYIYDLTTSSYRLTIKNGGNVLIGTTTDNGARLQVSGTSFFSSDLLIGTTSNSPSSNVGIKTYADGRIYCVSSSSTNTSESYSMYSTGAANYRFYVGWGGTIYATSTSISGISDISLKTNIRDLDKGLQDILQLKPRRFDWKNGDGKDNIGFVAQEIESIFPELISEYKYNQFETKKSLKMGDLIPSLVKAIQELKQEIDTLKN